MGFMGPVVIDPKKLAIVRDSDVGDLNIFLLQEIGVLCNNFMKFGLK